MVFSSDMRRKPVVQLLVFPAAGFVALSLLLWQYSAQILDSALQAGGEHFTGVSVSLSGSSFNPLKPSYQVDQVAFQAESASATPFITADGMKAVSKWTSLGLSQSAIESIQIDALTFVLVRDASGWNIESLLGLAQSPDSEESTEQKVENNGPVFTLNLLKIKRLELRIQSQLNGGSGKDRSVVLNDLLFQNIDFEDAGITVDQLLELVIGLGLNQLSVAAGDAMPKEVIRDVAERLLPEAVDFEFTSRVAEAEAKIQEEVGRVLKDLERGHEELQRLDRIFPIAPKGK